MATLIITLLVLVDNKQHNLERTYTYNNLQECQADIPAYYPELDKMNEQEILGYSVHCETK